LGDVTGKLKGDVTGNVLGDVTGKLTGDVTGNLLGDVTGNVKGDVAGKLTGDVIGNITVENSYADGGGIKLGKDKWVIAENSAGQLCFYNLQIDGSGLPLACIGGAGPQAGKLLPGKV